MTRRKTYIVTTTYISKKKYEIKAVSANDAKELIRLGWRAGCIDVQETYNIDNAYVKEKDINDYVKEKVVK